MSELPQLSSREIVTLLEEQYRGTRKHHLFAIYGGGAECAVEVAGAGRVAIVPVESELDLREKMEGFEGPEARAAFLVPWSTAVPLDLLGRFARNGKVLRIIGIVVGTIMAVGAVFGALNTMFATVAARAREIATLRAIGFRGLPVVVAVMLETMLLAMLGGVLGGFIAWVVFDGYGASTLAGGVGQMTFEFLVTPALLWSGLKWALAIGFVGGLFPAVRAAQLPVTTALRAA